MVYLRLKQLFLLLLITSSCKTHTKVSEESTTLDVDKINEHAQKVKKEEAESFEIMKKLTEQQGKITTITTRNEIVEIKETSFLPDAGVFRTKETKITLGPKIRTEEVKPTTTNESKEVDAVKQTQIVENKEKQKENTLSNKTDNKSEKKVAPSISCISLGYLWAILIIVVVGLAVWKGYKLWHKI